MADSQLRGSQGRRSVGAHLHGHPHGPWSQRATHTRRNLPMAPAAPALASGITATLLAGDPAEDLPETLAAKTLAGAAVVVVPELMAGPGERKVLHFATSVMGTNA